MNENDMASHALGTMGEWIQGYTGPGLCADGVQHQIRILDSDDTSILVSATPIDYSLGHRHEGDEKTFRISVRVREETI